MKESFTHTRLHDSHLAVNLHEDNAEGGEETVLVQVKGAGEVQERRLLDYNLTGQSAALLHQLDDTHPLITCPVQHKEGKFIYCNS